MYGELVMNKIKMVIPSRDRGCQLFALLESIDINALLLFDISVIYKATSEDYRAGYDIVQNHYPEVNFVEETDFRANVEEELETDRELFAFCTDDCLFYRNIYKVLGYNAYEEISNALHYNVESLCYALRLGSNVTKENYYGGRDLPPIQTWTNGRSLAWRWKNVAHSSLGYPLSVDAHIFLTSKIRRIVSRAVFDTPNSLEGNMASFALSLPEDVMLSPMQSVVYSNSCNRTQNDWTNHCGSKFPLSVEELNQRFLAGDRIDVAAMKFDNIISMHDEVEMKWRKEC